VDTLGTMTVRGDLVLRQLVPTDIAKIHKVAMSDAARLTWRTRGNYWSHLQLEQRLATESVFTAVATLASAPNEFVSLYELLDADLLDRRAHLGVLANPAYHRTGAPILGTLMFMEEAFRRLPLEKLAVSVLESNVNINPGLERYLKKEAHFERELYINGDPIDVVQYAIWRDDLPTLWKVFSRAGRA
jgi:RimJ/RimL family protein N-acetyltransferase